MRRYAALAPDQARYNEGMKVSKSIAFALMLPVMAQSAHAPARVARRGSLEDLVNAEVRGFQGKVNLFAKNLDSGRTFGYGPDARVRTASTIKLPLLAAAFQMVAEGKASWEDRVTLSEEDKVGGAGILPELAPGDSITLRSLSHLMIVLSDNTATNILLDHFPGDYVNEWAEHFGMPNTKFLRKIGGASPTKAAFDPQWAPFGLGVSTSREMVMLMEGFERGTVVSQEASREIISILKRQQDRNGIPRKLPGLEIANKTGALDHLRSDVGIVYSKKGRIVMAITCDDIPQVDWSTDNPGYVKIAHLAEILVNGLSHFPE
jgi:beta-lactamase class A